MSLPLVTIPPPSIAHIDLYRPLACPQAMEKLDGDKKRIKAPNGQKAARDCVQFCQLRPHQVRLLGRVTLCQERQAVQKPEMVLPCSVTNCLLDLALAAIQPFCTSPAPYCSVTLWRAWRPSCWRSCRGS